MSSEGPRELSLKFEPGKIKTYTTSRTCPEAVPGGKIMVVATGVDKPKDANLVFRVSYQTKTGPWQQTVRFRMLMFPATPTEARMQKPPSIEDGMQKPPSTEDGMQNAPSKFQAQDGGD